jgi:type IV secretion system protein VirD4
MCKQPQSSRHGGVLLGWNVSSRGRFGFASGDQPPSAGEPVCYRGDNHLMTVAPTGAGKGRGVIIPNLLGYPGPAVIIDPKGEAYQTTARRRRQMGQEVVVLDPFRVVAETSDRLNPLDVFDLPGAVVDCDAEMMASLLSMGHHFTRDPFWSDSATGVVSGLIAHVGTTAQTPEERTLNRLRQYLSHDDMDHQLAHLLDQKAVKNQLARDEIVGYLSHPAKETRPSVRTTACTYVKALGSASVAATLGPSSFKLSDVVNGKPMTIYVVIPPEKLESHRALLRLWVGTLLTAVTSRRVIPPARTLFILDESAQLGTLGALKQAITLLRGYGLQVWTFWQDLSQLKTLYANDWQTMLNNSGVLQIFGLNNHLMAKEWAEVMGVEAPELAALDRADAALFVQGEYQRCRRPDYLRDRVFRGQYDDNPRFALLNRTEEEADDVALAV